MTVKKLISKLRKLDPNLLVCMYAHDHDPSHYDEGAGEVAFVSEVTDNRNETKVALQPFG